MTAVHRSEAVAKATDLARLHTDPELLVLVNVWDAASAKAVADQGSRVVATASHSIAAARGLPDGERITRDAMIEAVAGIVEAVTVPVTADLERGYGDPGETVRRAIGVGVVGGNLEDHLIPLPEAAAAVRAAVAAGEAEGVPFVVNARTDAFFLAGDRDPAQVLADAIERGRAFLDEGAACVFVPAMLDETQVTALVEGLGERKLSVMGIPGTPPPTRLAELGVARVSYGPWSHLAAMKYLGDLTRELLAGNPFPNLY